MINGAPYTALPSAGCHVLYEPAAAAMTVSFHVRDGQSGEVRSPQMRFSLAPGGQAEAGPVPATVPEHP